MRDVEAKHIVALMEFMYAGEVNVAQAHLSAFLKTAESLKIRGLTETSSVCDFKEPEEVSLRILLVHVLLLVSHESCIVLVYNFSFVV